MNSVYHIRRAQPNLDDTRDLLQVEGQSLADSDYTPQETVAVLRRPEHYAYLAYAGQAPVGFCSCLETPFDAGTRLEIDMLGVLPDHRRRGLATRLIAHSIVEARQRGVRHVRAIVARDNLGSRRAFQRAGLQIAQRTEMMVYDIQGTAPLEILPPAWQWCILSEGCSEIPTAGRAFCADSGGREAAVLLGPDGVPHAAAECLHVQTLSYCGLWIEALWAVDLADWRLIARLLVERAKALELDEVGYLQPESVSANRSAALLREGYTRVGSYDVLSDDGQINA